MEIQEEKTIIETTNMCDFCKKEIAYKSCSGCGKDICNDCIKSWDDTYSEDYPDKFCARCTNIRDKYKNKLYKLQEMIDELQNKCDNECSS